MSYPEAIHQRMVAVSCSQKPQGDGQPQFRVQCLPVEGILLGSGWSQSVEQFPEHSWFYSDKVLATGVDCYTLIAWAQFSETGAELDIIEPCYEEPCMSNIPP